jgi:peptide/nickel transport system substrate-binding protein
MKSNKYIIITLILFIFTAVFFFINKTVSNKKHLDILRLSIPSDPKTFNPIMAQDAVSSYISSFMFEGLIKIDGITLKEKPCLAKSWDISEDGRIWKFYLRDDVYWSDGKKFTAKDVVFTFNELIYNKNIPSSSRDVFTIDGKEIKVERIDDYAVKFELPYFFSIFLLELSHPILPAHILKESVDKEKFLYTWGIDTKLKNIIGTGSFMLHQYSPGERIVLKKNPFYWRKDKQNNKLPYLDYIAVSIIPDNNTVNLKFIRGELDVISIGGEDYSYITSSKNYKKNYDIYNTGAGLSSSFIVFNQNKTKIPLYKYKWFSNLKFRQAVSYAIDRNTIIDNVFYTKADSQYGAVTKANKKYYTDKIKKYEYNLEKSKALLSEIGFKDKNNDKVLEDNEGNDIEFNLFITAQAGLSSDLCNIIKDDLAKIGIKINIVSLQFNVLVNKLLADKDWDAVNIGLSGGVEPYFGKNVWDSKSQMHLWNLDNKGIITDWEKEIDDIFNNAEKEQDIVKRKELYNRWQILVSEYLPFIYTAVPDVIYGINKRLKNIKPSNFAGVLHNVEEIRIKRESVLSL